MNVVGLLDHQTKEFLGWDLWPLKLAELWISNPIGFFDRIFDEISLMFDVRGHTRAYKRSLCTFFHILWIDIRSNLNNLDHCSWIFLRAFFRSLVHIFSSKDPLSNFWLRSPSCWATRALFCWDNLSLVVSPSWELQSTLPSLIGSPRCRNNSEPSFVAN